MDKASIAEVIESLTIRQARLKLALQELESTLTEKDIPEVLQLRERIKNTQFRLDKLTLINNWKE